ncbi:MAG: hypothetical protein KL863_14370 [Rhizobium sp.]|nr:hypothetical protein [Rhizobium sp.]
MPITPIPAAAEGMPNFSRRESDDAYSFVVCRLNARWRVIRCRDEIQWIVQTINQIRDRRAEWKGVKYLRTRDGLICSSCKVAGEIDPSALATLHALPERI